MLTWRKDEKRIPRFVYVCATVLVLLICSSPCTRKALTPSLSRSFTFKLVGKSNSKGVYLRTHPMWNTVVDRTADKWLFFIWQSVFFCCCFSTLDSQEWTDDWRGSSWSRVETNSFNSCSYKGGIIWNMLWWKSIHQS